MFAHRWTLVALAAIGLGFAAPAVSLAGPVQVGYFTDGNNTTAPAGPITAAGDTPVQIANFATANFSQFAKVLLLESNNGSPSAAVQGRAGDLAAYVAGGGGLMYFSRNVTQGGFTDSQLLPGGAGIAMTTSFGTDINITTPGTLVTNGPGGIITNTNLDGGNLSTHGWADASTLPAGAINLLNDGNPNHSVAFAYKFGAGWVFYSTSPLDFYLNGAGNNPPRDNFNNILAPNVIAYVDSLLNVPEPTSCLLFGAGLCGLIGYRRRQRAVVA